MNYDGPKSSPQDFNPGWVNFRFTDVCLNVLKYIHDNGLSLRGEIIE